MSNVKDSWWKDCVGYMVKKVEKTRLLIFSTRCDSARPYIIGLKHSAPPPDIYRNIDDLKLMYYTSRIPVHIYK